MVETGGSLASGAAEKERDVTVATAGRPVSPRIAIAALPSSTTLARKILWRAATFADKRETASFDNIVVCCSAVEVVVWSFYDRIESSVYLRCIANGEC